MRHIDKALEQGKGVVLFTCHIGNFEWGACRLAVDGYAIRGVSLIRKSKRTNWFFESKRLSKDVQTLYINRIVNVFKYLKDNEIIAIPSDWDSSENRKRQFDFYGKKAYLPTGAVQIALKSGAALIPCFIWRKDKYTHQQIVEEPIKLDRTGEKEEQLEKNIKKVLPLMEKYISEHIEEWELFHNIWVN